MHFYKKFLSVSLALLLMSTTIKADKSTHFIENYPVTSTISGITLTIGMLGMVIFSDKISESFADWTAKKIKLLCGKELSKKSTKNIKEFSEIVCLSFATATLFYLSFKLKEAGGVARLEDNKTIPAA